MVAFDTIWYHVVAFGTNYNPNRNPNCNPNPSYNPNHNPNSISISISNHNWLGCIFGGCLALFSGVGIMKGKKCPEEGLI